MKTHLPTADEITEKLEIIGLSRGYKLHLNELDSILQKLNKNQFLSKFAPKASGEHLLLEVKINFFILVNLFYA